MALPRTLSHFVRQASAPFPVVLLTGPRQVGKTTLLQDQREIDLVIEADGVLHPVEIKKTASPGRDALRGAAALARLGVPVGEGAVICLVPDAIPLGRSVQAVPVGWV